MNRNVFARTSMAAAAALVLTLSPNGADAQTRVQYGRITNAVPTTVTASTPQNIGTIIGGGLGLASGSGQSGSNRALRTLGGAAAGRGVGTLAGRSQAIEYTVLIDGLTTVRIVSDQVGKRVGDCVAVEQGQFNNIRLAPESRCTPASAPTTPRPPTAAPASAAAVEAANACDQAKVQVLNADSEEAFTLAERRMRLLCGE